MNSNADSNLCNHMELSGALISRSNWMQSIKLAAMEYVQIKLGTTKLDPS